MPSGIYGAEHLLRLFVRMPLFLSRAQLPAGHVQTLHHYFKELLELVIILWLCDVGIGGNLRV